MNEAALSLTSPENRDEIERRISDLKTRTGKTYSACRDEIRRQCPSLFGLSPAPVTIPLVNNRRTPLTLTDVREQEDQARADARKARGIADAISEYRIKNRDATYSQARDAVRQESPELFI